MKRLIIFLCLIVCFIAADAQRTIIYTEKDAEYKTALDLFNKEKYSSAQRLFNKVYASYYGRTSETATQAQFYAAVCAYELFNGDAEKLLLNFINDHSDHNRTREASLYLANFLYRKKRFKEAIPYYDKINIYELSEELKSDYFFKSAYCYFVCGDLNKAKNNFYQVKDSTRYASSAAYYYSHISYLQKNYQIALDGFMKLQKNENFAPVVPYYIAQILYLQEKFEEVIAYAPGLLDSANAQRAPEIARIIGESFYLTKRYKQAIPYFEKYQKGENIRTTREDDYQLAFCFYKSENHKGAISLLKSVAVVKDSLGQNALYLLGDCQIKTDKKKQALMAFDAASRMQFDKEITEDALFNYAKLSLELDMNPFDQSIKAFEKYLNTYPQSPRKDEAYNYLLTVYLTTKNYDAALTSIDNINEKNQSLKYAYQKVSYLMGIQHFNDRNYNKAISYFIKSDIYALDKNISALATYWKAESFYRLNDYDKAIEQYKNFIYQPAAILQDVFNDAHYNLGYCYYQKMQYDEATSWFRKFISDKKENNQKKLNDAYIRAGDCYFIKKDLAEAIEYYNNAIKIKLIDIDYALFQKSVASGVLGKYDQKIETLDELIKNYSSSKHMPEACYEMANTNLLKGDNDKALLYFDKVINTYVNSSYLKKALLKKGLIFYNSNKDEQAMEIYKRIVADYPSTIEAREALSGIKNIFVEAGKVDEYADYIKNVPFANVTVSELDSTAFEVAEKYYMKGDCEKAIVDFGNYLVKYPNGIFLLNANYYKADCEAKSNKNNEALNGFDYVISQPKNKFTEAALLKAARIAKGAGNWQLCADYYSKLEVQAEDEKNMQEAVINLMRCNFKLNKYNESKSYAAKAQTLNKVTLELSEEAKLIAAKSSLGLGDSTQALSEFTALSNSSNSETGTEANYLKAMLLFSKNLTEESEKVVYEIIRQEPAYDYWIANAFILLADIFERKNDLFSAKNTLQSIIDNSDNPELIKTAQAKLDKILEKEKNIELKKMSVPVIQINISDDKSEEQLFEEDTTNDNNNE